MPRYNVSVRISRQTTQDVEITAQGKLTAMMMAEDQVRLEIFQRHGSLKGFEVKAFPSDIKEVPP